MLVHRRAQVAQVYENEPRSALVAGQFSSGAPTKISRVKIGTRIDPAGFFHKFPHRHSALLAMRTYRNARAHLLMSCYRQYGHMRNE